MSSSPRRYRRRLVAVMLGAGLVPLLVLGLASWVLSERVLAVSLSPVEEVLDRVDEAAAVAAGRGGHGGVLAASISDLA